MELKDNRKEKIKVLCLEDEPRDAEIIRELLIDSEFDLVMDCTAVEKEFASLLRSRTYDIILSDFKLPGFDGFTALRWVMEICPKVPFICVSGTIGEESAVELLKLGAVDFVMKDKLARLPAAIKRALDEAKEKEIRRRTEEALRESETRYRSVLQSATDAIVTADSSGIIIGWNSGAERIFGYSYTEAAGQPLTSLMPFYHHTRHTNGMKRVISGGDRHVIGKTVEIEGLRKDGSVFPLELSLSTWETKSGQFFTGIIRDITERKRVEEALIASELRYRSLFESAKDGILIFDAETGKIIDANPFLLEILDYSREEVIGKELWEIGSFKNIIANQDTFRKLQLQEYIHYEHLLLYNKDGVTIHVEFVSNIYFMDEHKVIQCNIRNITERKLLEDQMRQLQKLEGLGTLAGGIAHDFNNILGIILAYITSTHRFKDDTKKLDLAVDTIVKAVERGKTLVQQILTFARKTETTFGAVDVNDVVMEIMTMIFETFPKTLTYAQNFDKSVPYINADRSQLHQVLLNLCVNARDAMPTGGVLTINTRMVSGLSLRNQHPDAAASDYVCIEVSDTGEGMTEEIKERLFEPFFTTKGIGKGTGLGLSVVFGIVQTHKGFIDVESELGNLPAGKAGGTTFRVYLPASRAAEPISVKDEETLEEIPGGTETLLVVEDEEMLMMSLRMVLVEKGYKVLSSGDGLAALKIYQEKKNDIALVLTDLGLPTITGLEVSQRIKKINPNEHIILATGFLDPNMKSEFLKAGIQHFLYKPYDLKQVLKVVREVLDEE
jgi:PAS domain S-box-containing protein